MWVLFLRCLLWMASIDSRVVRLIAVKGGLAKEAGAGGRVEGAVAGPEDKMRRGGGRSSRPLWRLHFRLSRGGWVSHAHAAQG